MEDLILKQRWRRFRKCLKSKDCEACIHSGYRPGEVLCQRPNISGICGPDKFRFEPRKIPYNVPLTILKPDMLNYKKGMKRYEKSKVILKEWGFKYIFMSGGYYIDTGQNCYGFFILKGSDQKIIEEVKTEILAIIPHIKPGHGFLQRFAIKEWTNGNGGCYELALLYDKWVINKHTYGTETEEHTGTLDEMLKIIAEKYFREKSCKECGECIDIKDEYCPNCLPGKLNEVKS